MSVKINFPTKFRELVGETGVYEVYGTFVYAYFGLRDWVGFMQTCEGFRDTYLTTTSIFHTEMSAMGMRLEEAAYLNGHPTIWPNDILSMQKIHRKQDVFTPLQS